MMRQQFQFKRFSLNFLPSVGRLTLAGIARGASETEYIATLARLFRAGMRACSADAAVDVIGVLAQRKDEPTAHRAGS